MSIGSGNRGTWGKGTAVFLAVLLGILFLRDLPSRLTVLAARQPLFFFLSKEEERGLAGNGILRQASGIGTLSSFIEEQDAIQTRAEADPAYRAWRSEAGSGVLLSAQAEGAGAGNGPAGEQAQETAGAGQTEGGTPSDGGTSPEGGLPAGEEAGGTGAPADPGQPAMAASEVRGTVYTQEQLADFEFVKKNFFYVHKSTTVYPEQLDASVLLGKDMTLPESGEPQILLFHTHGSEAFSDSEKGNPDMTVVGLGNYLDPGGVFIFDLNTPYKYEVLLADHTFAEVREEGSFIWENFYEEESGINEYDLTLFIREESGGRYRRFRETHYQRAYTLEQVRRAAREAGLLWEAVYDAFTKEPAREDSERVHIILREQGKEAAR